MYVQTAALHETVSRRNVAVASLTPDLLVSAHAGVDEVDGTSAVAAAAAERSHTGRHVDVSLSGETDERLVEPHPVLSMNFKEEPSECDLDKSDQHQLELWESDSGGEPVIEYMYDFGDAHRNEDQTEIPMLWDERVSVTWCDGVKIRSDPESDHLAIRASPPEPETWSSSSDYDDTPAVIDDEDQPTSPLSWNHEAGQRSTCQPDLFVAVEHQLDEVSSVDFADVADTISFNTDKGVEHRPNEEVNLAERSLPAANDHHQSEHNLITKVDNAANHPLHSISQNDAGVDGNDRPSGHQQSQQHQQPQKSPRRIRPSRPPPCISTGCQSLQSHPSEHATLSGQGDRYFIETQTPYATARRRSNTPVVAAAAAADEPEVIGLDVDNSTLSHKPAGGARVRLWKRMKVQVRNVRSRFVRRVESVLGIGRRSSENAYRLDGDDAHNTVDDHCAP